MSGVLGFVAVIALALCALPERASACGACSCFEHRWARFPADPAPLNLHVLIDATPAGTSGTPLDLSALRLRRRDDGAVVSFVLEPFGTGTDLYWLVPSALEPATYYDLDVAGTPDSFETFLTGDASDSVAATLGVITVEHPVSDDACVSRAGVTLAFDAGGSVAAGDAGADSGAALDAGSRDVDLAALEVDVDLPGGEKQSVVLLPTAGAPVQQLSLGSMLDSSHPVGACLGPAELRDGTTGITYPAHVTAIDFAGNPSATQDIVFELEPLQAASCPDPSGGGGYPGAAGGGFYDDYNPVSYGGYQNLGNDVYYGGSNGGCVCSTGARSGSHAGSALALVGLLALRIRRRSLRRLAERRAPRRG